MPGEAAQIIDGLAASRRVLVLGGLAVIAHGLSRTTQDSDIWLDPGDSIAEWCEVVGQAVQPHSGAYFFDVSRHQAIARESLDDTIDFAGMVRIGGLDRYLDIFYQPHQLDVADFEAAWSSASLGMGNARVMDESFLIATKLDTGRSSDREDITFLEGKLRSEHSRRLEGCSPAEAEALFSRYLDHVTCLAAMRNPDAGVRQLGLDGLRELAEGGNPYAIEALKNI